MAPAKKAPAKKAPAKKKAITQAQVSACLGPVGTGPKMSPKRVAEAGRAMCHLYPQLSEAAARSCCHHMAAAHKCDPKMSFDAIHANLAKMLPAIKCEGGSRYYAGSSGLPQVIGGAKTSAPKKTSATHHALSGFEALTTKA